MLQPHEVLDSTITAVRARKRRRGPLNVRKMHSSLIAYNIRISYLRAYLLIYILIKAVEAENSEYWQFSLLFECMFVNYINKR